MTTPRTSGNSGQHASRIRRQNKLRAIKFALPIPVLAYLALRALQADLAPLAGALVLVAVGCYLAATKANTKATKQGVGAKAEQQVAAALAHTNAYVVLNSVDLPGVPGDADHLVFGPRGIACVETKAGGGQTRVNGSGQLVTGQGRIVPGDPIGQVHGQAAAAERALGRAVEPIVCVPWMRNAPYTHQGVTICSTTQLPGVLSRMNGNLDHRTAHRLAGKLS